MTCHKKKKFFFHFYIFNLTTADPSITEVDLFTQRSAAELWLTRLFTEDLEDKQHAEWSYHAQLQHHEDSLNPLHKLKMGHHTHIQQSGMRIRSKSITILIDWLFKPSPNLDLGCHPYLWRGLKVYHNVKIILQCKTRAGFSRLDASCCFLLRILNLELGLLKLLFLNKCIN